MNTLPVEILEKIITKSVSRYWSDYNGNWIYNHYMLKKYALVCRTWALIVNPILWKVVNLSGSTDSNNEFRFYKHIMKPGYTFGKYIQKLSLNKSELWPICIIKILRACPNIVDLTIRSYRYRDSKNRGKVNNLLEQIQDLTPNLKRLNLEYSGDNITGIEKLIKDRKDLQILATRYNSLKQSVIEKYNGKEWVEYDEELVYYDINIKGFLQAEHKKPQNTS
jgi:hypothetical protein